MNQSNNHSPDIQKAGDQVLVQLNQKRPGDLVQAPGGSVAKGRSDTHRCFEAQPWACGASLSLFHPWAPQNTYRASEQLR